MKSAVSSLTPRKIALFFECRLTRLLAADTIQALQGYLEGLLARREFPPYRGTRIDLDAVAAALGAEVTQLRAARSQLHPIFDAVARAVADAELRPRTKGRNDRDGDKSVQGSMKRPGRRPKACE